MTGAARVLASLAVVMLSLIAGNAGASMPTIGHVFIVVLENESFAETFGDKSPARYLNQLAGQGALLRNYYGIGHYSLDNYIAMISGQAPNPVTQGDCQVFADFVATGVDADGQALGSGCVYPANIQTIAGQLDAKGLGWKAYMEDMGNDPARESATCGHPAIGKPDSTQRAQIGDQYATRHNPFVYFHSIIDLPSCGAHVVGLNALAGDLAAVATTPSLVFVTPNLCHDGHDGGERGRCVDGQPGGLVSADAFLGQLVPQILASPAYRKDGLLIVTFDEAEIDAHFDAATGKLTVKAGDATACCGEPPGPDITPDANVFGLPDQGPGVIGPGGGRIGAVLVSPAIKPGTVSSVPYNHYAMLKSLEDMFGLDHLGYAGRADLKEFGSDIFAQ